MRIERTGRRADVVLDDPDRHNPQTPALWRALARVGRELDGEVDVVVLRGSGPSFSAGLDRALLAPGAADGPVRLVGLPPAQADAEIASYQEAFTLWSDSSFVSIAAVAGHAIGAGFQLALACDLRVAASDASFAMRETLLGLVPDLGGTARLVEAVGYARALEICASARPIDAEEALRLGLVQRVVPGADLAMAVDETAAPFLGERAAAVIATLALLRQARADIADHLAAERAAQMQRLRALTAAIRS